METIKLSKDLYVGIKVIKDYTYLISGTKLPELDNIPKTLPESLKRWYNTNSYKDEEISLIDFRNIDGYAQDRKI